MKKAFLLTVTALAALLATSCQKDDLGRILTATIEQYEHNGGAKAYINSDNYACWENGDTVNINGTRCTIRFEEGTQGTANSAIIDGASFPATDPLMAFYPAGMVRNLSATGGTVTLPQMQSYEETTVGGVTYQKIQNPMAAYCPAGSDELRFRNLCALLKITIQAPAGEGLQVKDIVVKGDDDQMLWGTATLKLDNQHRPMLSKMANGSAVVRLKFDTPVEIIAGASQSFYIVVPAPSTFLDFSIIVFTGQEKLYMKESELGQGLLRNQIGALTYTPAEADAGSGSTILYEGSIDGFRSDAFGDARVIFHAGGFLIFDRTLTTIGQSAFEGCSSLESITFPASLTTIGESAFWSCSSLESITLPANLTTTGDYAFGGCSSLESIDLSPTGVTSIGKSTFRYCSSLKSITLPAGLTTIGESAFYSCSGLRSISLPANLTTIGKNAFSYCTSLSSIDLSPTGVTTIGEDAFSFCSGLGSISLPANLTTIEDNTFYGCSGLGSIALPADLTTIGKDAFYGCSGLSSIALPASLTSIGENAFWGCSSLTTVYVNRWNSGDPQITPYGSQMFQGCNALSHIYVPSAAVDTYKGASGWSNHANIIEAMP